MIAEVAAADLSAEDAALLAEAREAQARAYAPYSGFHVGAALRDADGVTWAGCNVENAAYPATICAERTAVVSAVAAGQRTFSAIAVVGSGDGPTTPCGTCRQVLFEFAPDLRVIAAGESGGVAVATLADLLPGGFGPVRLHGAQ